MSGQGSWPLHSAQVEALLRSSQVPIEGCYAVPLVLKVNTGNSSTEAQCSGIFRTGFSAERKMKLPLQFL